MVILADKAYELMPMSPWWAGFARLPSFGVVPHSIHPVAMPLTIQETEKEVSVGFCTTGGLRTLNALLLRKVERLGGGVFLSVKGRGISEREGGRPRLLPCAHLH